MWTAWPATTCPAAGRQREEALTFLQWVYHDSICNILTLLSGQPICRSSTQNTEVLELYPWLKYLDRNVEDGSLLSRRFSSLAVNPDFRGSLLTALTNGYINADQLAPALQRIQDAWRDWSGEEGA